MNKAECKSFGEPDEVREFPKGRLELLKIGGATVGRARGLKTGSSQNYEQTITHAGHQPD